MNSVFKDCIILQYTLLFGSLELGVVALLFRHYWTSIKRPLTGHFVLLSVGGSNDFPRKSLALTHPVSHCVLKSHILLEVTLFFEDQYGSRLGSRETFPVQSNNNLQVLACGRRRQYTWSNIAEHHLETLKDSGTAVDCEVGQDLINEVKASCLGEENTKIKIAGPPGWWLRTGLVTHSCKSLTYS